MIDDEVFQNKQVTEDLIMGFLERSPYFWTDRRIVREFEIHYRKPFKDPRSLRKIYTSIAGLLNTGKIIYDEDTGYTVAENG